MDREKAKELWPVIKAYSEGKEIEVFNIARDEWVPAYNPVFSQQCDYRIKTVPSYRHFNSHQECWNEMLKHQPFGWIKTKSGRAYINIVSVFDDEDAIEMSPESDIGDGDNPVLCRKFINLHDTLEYEFADGTPFGIKEE